MQLNNNLLDKYRYINVEHNDWHDCEIDYWKEKLEQVGYSNVEIQYSGFCSQGDGASFTANVYPKNLTKFMDQHNLAATYPHMYSIAQHQYVSLRMTRLSSRYSHEHTVEGDGEMETMYEPDESADLREAAMWEIYCKAEHEFPELVKSFEDISRDYMQQIYSDLENEYDHLTSDEAVKETLLANDIH